MTKQAQLPDGTVLEFPEGTPDAVMDKVVKEHLAVTPAANNSDFGRMVSGAKPDEPNFLEKQLYGAQGKAEGLLEAGAGLTQTALMGGPGGVITREIAKLLGADTSGMRDPLARGAESVGEFAGTMRQNFDESPAGQTFEGKSNRFVGQVAPSFLISGGGATFPARVASATAGGIGSTAFTPVEGGDYATEKGKQALLAGGAGALGQAALSALQKVAGLAGNFTQAGAQRKAADILRMEADNPNALLNADPSVIPGAQRTLAEETLDSGLARLERNARSTGKGWDALDRTNNAARVGAIENFAGDAASIEALAKARADTAGPLRMEALKITGVDTARLLSQIGRMHKAQEGRPAIQAGLNEIRQLLTRQIPESERKRAALAPIFDYLSKGRKSVADAEAAKEAMKAIRRGELPEVKLSSKAGQDAIAAAKKALETEFRGQDRVAVLDNVRMTIGDMLSGKYGGDNAKALAGSRQLMAVKNQLDRVLAKQAPEYGQYIDAFRTGSVPINRQQIGQHLLTSRSGSATIDPVTGKQVLTPAAFSGRARDLDKVAAEATGFRKAKAANSLTPADLQAIANVQRDLERRGFAATAGSGGNSHTFERGKVDERLVGGMIKKIPLVGPGFEYLGQLGQQRMLRQLNTMLQNPAAARAALAKPPPPEKKMPAALAAALLTFQQDQRKRLSRP